MVVDVCKEDTLWSYNYVLHDKFVVLVVLLEEPLILVDLEEIRAHRGTAGFGSPSPRGNCSNVVNIINLAVDVNTLMTTTTKNESLASCGAVRRSLFHHMISVLAALLARVCRTQSSCGKTDIEQRTTTLFPLCRLDEDPPRRARPVLIAKNCNIRPVVYICLACPNVPNSNVSTGF